VESFGRYLTRQRELRGMTRAEVVQLTRLPAGAIDALEEDRFEALPARAFAVGYLRLYAAAIGMNSDDAVLRFEEWGLAHPAEAPPPPVLARPRPRRRRRRWAIAAGAAAVAAAVAWWWSAG
jgi:cytoskeletal protein RodZ